MSHSLFSPSAAHRWATCPGSVVLSRNVNQTGSVASQEGTRLHTVMQRHMEKAVSLDKFELTDEQRAVVTECATYVRSLPKQESFYELKVCFANAVGQDEKECIGTSDVIQINGSTLRVIDYKFGRRYVSPTNNLQGVLYMLGAANTLSVAGYDFDSYEFEILQPRVGDEVSNGVFVLTKEELYKSAESLTVACQNVKRAMTSYAVMPDDAWQREFLHSTEDACAFCPVAASCPKLQAVALQRAREMEEAIEDFPEAMTKRPEDDLATRYAELPILKEYMRAVETEAMGRALNGVKLPGLMLVQGRAGNREWSNEVEVLDALAKTGLAKSDMVEQVVLSPAKMQNRLVAMGMSKREAKGLVDGLTQRSEAKPALVPESKGGIPYDLDKMAMNDFSVV